MLRATGCQGGRTPLLMQEGSERSATGGGYRTLIPNPKSLVVGGGSHDVGKSKMPCPDSSGFPESRRLLAASFFALPA
jgi:hypothetical protein